MLSLLLLLACADDLVPTTPQVVSDAFSVRASVEQVHVWSAPPDALIEVLDADGAVIAEGHTDELGSLILRGVTPGADYTVRLGEDPDELTDQLEVMTVDGSQPDPSFYSDQVLEPGNGYIETRDGTLLSYYLYLPGPPEDGPYPTLVNYSGYSPSAPGQSLGEAAEPFCELYPILCDAPSFATGIIAGVIGYAVVGVNIRGTGCSGGAYDYFETLQLLDGYDVIETVAAQPWVAHGQVGMSGLSYPGITQLFVAKTRPPGLAAITPFSVLADTVSSTLLPGGLFNKGFAEQWYLNVLEKAAPYGHGWIEEVVAEGDTVCEENQLLHSQVLNVLDTVKDTPYYSEELAAPVDPTRFVGDIEAAVYVSGQWQDEQTGPHFAALFDKFDSAPVARFNVSNGVHVDGFSPQNLVEWMTFLDLYVAREVPSESAALSLIGPSFMESVFGDDLSVPDNRFDHYETYEEALAAYEAEGPLRVLFEAGTAEGIEPGAPEAAFEARFDAWPPPEAEVMRWYLQPDGGLAPEPPGEDGGASSWEHDPLAGDEGTLASGGVSTLQPDWAWTQPVEGMALSFLTEPLEEDIVWVGHGSVDLWLMTDSGDADVEVTISEVRPDGQEVMVQHGWLRASFATLTDEATETRPVHSYYAEDVVPLEPGEWTPIRVELMPASHPFRAGSQLRLTVDTPGGSMARWRFELLPEEEGSLNTVGHAAELPSSLALPVIPDLEVPTALPPCEALRGQPCRAYQPIENLP